MKWIVRIGLLLLTMTMSASAQFVTQPFIYKPQASSGTCNNLDFSQACNSQYIAMGFP